MHQISQQALQHLLIEFNANPPLDEAMICIAVEEDEDADREAILLELDQIAADIYLPNPNDTIDVVSRINTHLFEHLGFKGDYDDYHNPQNSLIHRVLGRRRGLPIMLSGLYIEIARRLNIHVLGIGFPYHFIIQPKQYDHPVFFIDPFNKGAILLEADLQILLRKYDLDMPLSQAIVPNSTRKIIQRMSNNLFFSHKKMKDNQGILRSLERLILISPECPDLFRVRSVVLASMGKFNQAICSLKTYLHYCQDTPDREECERQLKILMNFS